MTKDADPSDPSYLTPYREAVRKFGASFESTLWNSREKQAGRFEVICEMVPLTGRVIVDAGAGIADLAQYLTDEGVEYGRYIGLEGVREMAAKANERKIPECEVIEADFASDAGVFEKLSADVIVFSGSLNTFDEADAKIVLARAFEACKEAVVFNFLSARNHVKDPPDPSPARRFDPVVMLGWALELTPSVRFRQDYFGGHDGTIAMFK